MWRMWVTNVIDVDKWVYFPAYCLGAKVTFYHQNWDLSNHSLLWNSNMKYAWGKSTLENSKFLAFSWVMFLNTPSIVTNEKSHFDKHEAWPKKVSFALTSSRSSLTRPQNLMIYWQKLVKLQCCPFLKSSLVYWFHPL